MLSLVRVCSLVRLLSSRYCCSVLLFFDPTWSSEQQARSMLMQGKAGGEADCPVTWSLQVEHGAVSMKWREGHSGSGNRMQVCTRLLQRL